MSTLAGTGGIGHRRQVRAIVYSVLFALTLAVFALPGGTLSEDMMYGSVAVIFGALAAQYWMHHVRFGGSRLLPRQSEVKNGDACAAVLDAAERLAQAREVRFDLVETAQLSADLVPVPSSLLPERVWATVVVPASAFQVVAGRTVVPLSITVPTDAPPSYSENKFGIHALPLPYIGYQKKGRAWQVRASADAGGARYRARFEIKVVPATAAPPMQAVFLAQPPQPYAPRPIVIPPSDKRPRP
jgi:hypothetical protein